MYRSYWKFLVLLGAIITVALAIVFSGKDHSKPLPVHAFRSPEEAKFVGALPYGGSYQLTLRVEGEESQEHPSPPRDSGGTTPDGKDEQRLIAFVCVINGTKMNIPEGSFRDLIAPRLDLSPKVEQDGRFISFTIQGGPGNGSYQAIFRIAPPDLTERRVERLGQPAALLLYQPGVPSTLASKDIPIQAATAAVP